MHLILSKRLKKIKAKTKQVELNVTVSEGNQTRTGIERHGCSTATLPSLLYFPACKGRGWLR